jgi:tetratricopeptide (TPR) repeat protein
MRREDPFVLALAGRYDEAEAVLAARRDADAEAVRAYLASARGEFEAALAIARRAMRRASVAAEARFRLLITAASAARQLRRYGVAESYDSKALALAGDDWACGHAYIGLAADAIGRGEAERCDARLRLAEKAAPAGDWRVEVRLRWVRCEHALTVGRPGDAVEAAREALDRSREAAAPRHEAKSWLFLGVSQREAGDDGWVESLGHARDLASRIGAKAIEGVAAAELARQHG